MVYESDFYTTRRPYRPSSYSYTTPRHYMVYDHPNTARSAEQQYSYSYNSTTENRGGGYSPQSTSYTSKTERRTGSGPGSNYNYSTESTSKTGGPGGYHSSYSSTTSGRLPHGTTYRHYSYRV